MKLLLRAHLVKQGKSTVIIQEHVIKVDMSVVSMTVVSTTCNLRHRSCEAALRQMQVAIHVAMLRV